MTNSPAPLVSCGLEIWKAAIAAVDGEKLTHSCFAAKTDWLEIAGQRYGWDSFNRIMVLGGGKASGWMARGCWHALQLLVQDRNIEVIGQVNVPDDQVTTAGPIQVVGVRPAAENLPTQRVLEATSRMCELISSSTKDDLLVFLISGGGSATLERPIAGVTLDSVRHVTRALSAAGANIHEMNLVRTCLSRVKGGGLCEEAAADSSRVALILSDVIGDEIEYIASGPTVRHQIRMDDLEAILSNKAWAGIFDLSLKRKLRQSAKDRAALEATSVDPAIVNLVIGNHEVACLAAAKRATEIGFQVEHLSATKFESQTVEDVADQMVSRILRQVPVQAQTNCFITGGEPVVCLPSSPGCGGRNQHLVLSVLCRLLQSESKIPRFCFLSAGTDGEDGNSQAAGAWVDEAMVAAVRHDAELTRLARQRLEQCDSHSFFLKIGSLVSNGPTKTNVCDVQLLIHGGSDET